MRLDIQKAQHLDVLSHIKVFLNGQPLLFCLEFDTKGGWAIVYVRRGGSVVFDGDRIVTERLTGRITYTLASPPLRLARRVRRTGRAAQRQLRSMTW